MINTRTSSIWIDDNNTVHISIHPNSAISLEDAQKTTETVAMMVDGYEASLLLLVNTRGTKSMSREARAHLASVQTDLILARAIVIDSPIGQIIANFFLNINHPVIPTQMFTNEDAALAWLRTFFEKERGA
ncbi:MAG: hypothetical protein H6636_13780 [Anaerolineales bacterium]|nr:hypothetical protein [Anaerolineales bacterium]